MTEPPRPPGEPNPNDPTRPFNPYAANDPTSGSTPPPYTPPPGYGPPPGYQPPPPGYQPPPPGYQQGYGGAPTQDDRTWILVAHFGGAAGAFLGGGLSGWIAPLISLLAKGNLSPSVRAESVKALNFQITWAIVTLIGWVTSCIVIGFIIIPVAALIAIIFGIIAGVKASNNEPYDYPMSLKLIK
ncbi:DUF4870 domain-containing protein [Actinoplanes sp. NPDC048796]|uniref:DUF4870 domain-containing protein n=1 Tax=unclassified Actinoplanes TaxID=2626549 RepID=UPI0033E89CAF